MVAFARPIAAVFNAETVALTVAFIRVFALAVGGFSIARTMRGALRGSGDTSWPLYGKIVGLAARLSIAALALPIGMVIGIGSVSIAPGLGLGMTAVYAAILVDFYVQAVVNAARFRSGKWQIVARRSDVGSAAGGD